MANQALCAVPGCGKTVLARHWCRAHYLRWRKHGSPEGGGLARGARMAWLREHAGHHGDACLIWPFSRTTQGYGAVAIGGRTVNASRVMCELAHGEPPTPDHEAAHGCGNRPCCNPRHLRWDTRAGNFADKLLHHTDNRGENNPLARLTSADVDRIRAMRGTKSQAEIGRMFGIHQSTVCKIQLGKGWSWKP